MISELNRQAVKGFQVSDQMFHDYTGSTEKTGFVFSSGLSVDLDYILTSGFFMRNRLSGYL